MRSFSLIVLTPFGTFFEGEVESVTLWTSEGEMGILAGREKTKIAVDPGVIRWVQGGETKRFSEDGGIFEMRENGAILLCSAIYPEETAEQDRANREIELEKERERQKRSLSEYKLGQAALAKAFDKLKRARHTIK